jgi:hypothetical protein
MAAAAAAKAPSIKNERDRVFVENYPKDHKDPVDVKAELKETVYFGNCQGGVFKVNGKCKGITVNKCSNISIIFSTIVGNLELANLSKVQVQIDGDCPIIQMDACERCGVYIKEAKTASTVKIYSAKGTANNVYFPKGDDMEECPLPEQIVSQFKSGKLESHVGGKED